LSRLNSGSAQVLRLSERFLI